MASGRSPRGSGQPLAGLEAAATVAELRPVSEGVTAEPGERLGQRLRTGEQGLGGSVHWEIGQAEAAAPEALAPVPCCHFSVGLRYYAAHPASPAAAGAPRAGSGPRPPTPQGGEGRRNPPPARRPPPRRNRHRADAQTQRAPPPAPTWRPTELCRGHRETAAPPSWYPRSRRPPADRPGSRNRSDGPRSGGHGGVLSERDAHRIRGQPMRRIVLWVGVTTENCQDLELPQRPAGSEHGCRVHRRLHLMASLRAPLAQHQLGLERRHLERLGRLRYVGT